jgi:hypothetical protein
MPFLDLKFELKTSIFFHFYNVDFLASHSCNTPLKIDKIDIPIFLKILEKHHADAAKSLGYAI